MSTAAASQATGPTAWLPKNLVTNLIPHTPELEAEVLYQHWATMKRNAPPSVWDPIVDLPRFDPGSQAGHVVDRLQLTGTRLEILGKDLTCGGMNCRFVNDGSLAVGPDGRVSHVCRCCTHTATTFAAEGDACVLTEWGTSIKPPSPTSGTVLNTAVSRDRVGRFTFSPCIDCGACELRDSNEEDCYGNHFPCCGECLWAAGLVQCP